MAQEMRELIYTQCQCHLSKDATVRVDEVQEREWLILVTIWEDLLLQSSPSERGNRARWPYPHLLN
jgi:hypothetical protein